MDGKPEAVSARTVELGPKAGYWRSLAPFALMAPFAAFSVALTSYDYVSTGFHPADNAIGAWILLAFFGIGALVFLPGVLSSRKPSRLSVDATGAQLSRGNRERRIPWDEMTEVTWGPRRIRLGKTSAVGEGLRIRGTSELLPIEVDEITYCVDHDALAETIRLVVDTARKRHLAVTTPTSPEW